MHSFWFIDRKAGAQRLASQPNSSFLFRVNNLKCLIFRILENCTCQTTAMHVITRGDTVIHLMNLVLKRIIPSLNVLHVSND